MRTHHPSQHHSAVRPSPDAPLTTGPPPEASEGPPPEASEASESPSPAPTGRPPSGVAAELAPLLEHFLPDGVPVRITFWDESSIGEDHRAGSVRVTSPDAVRHLCWSPGELGLGRAYVAGHIDIDGDIVEVLAALRTRRLRSMPAPVSMPAIVSGLRRAGAWGAPLPAPREETRQRGVLHSRRRDAAAISHHYDVGNDFYRLVLGPSMTYSCARFVTPDSTLEDAQVAKFDLVCRKLGLHEHTGATLLDVGCGWGSLAIHAARRYGARVVGVSISREQVALARARVHAEGLDGLVDIRLQDYRDLGGEHFDAISSVGMFEHVGAKRIPEYFATLRPLLGPHGRLLNHAISSAGGTQFGGRSFVGRYVFPDGELIDVGDVVLAMEDAGFEVRDVESLREHYAHTLRRWVANLEASWDEAVELVGAGRARVWRLYMAGSVNSFQDGGISVHQVLGVVPDAHGRSGMPATRDGYA